MLGLAQGLLSAVKRGDAAGARQANKLATAMLAAGNGTHSPDLWWYLSCLLSLKTRFTVGQRAGSTVAGKAGLKLWVPAVDVQARVHALSVVPFSCPCARVIATLR